MILAVITHRTSLMQAIADRVRCGYRHYCTGTVAAERAGSWVRKACRYYAVDLDRNRRARARRRGEGCAYLLLHESEPRTLTWVLLVSPGEHPAHQLERLRDALDPAQRLSLLGYELVRLTKEQAQHPVWTWRWTEDTHASMRAGVIDAVRRGGTHDVRQVIVSLYRSAGFRGVRVQVGKAVALLRAEWKRHRGSAPLPRLPRALTFVQRLRIQSVPLTAWLSMCAGRPGGRTLDPAPVGETADYETTASAG